LNDSNDTDVWIFSRNADISSGPLLYSEFQSVSYRPKYLPAFKIDSDGYSSPCRCPVSIMINPTFSSLSIKYPAVKFLIVDTDKCEVCMMIVVLLPLITFKNINRK